ncbi:MAG: DNA repair protein RecO [Bacillota bacterium]
MALFKCEAIVLKAMELGEADRLVTLLTLRHGKIRVVAKGARKVMSRFSTATNTFVYSHFVLHRGKTLDTITQCDVREPFRGIREDLDRFAFAGHVADLADTLTDDGEPATVLFALLLTALRSIEGGCDPETVAAWFALNALAAAGYRPVLDRCTSCGATEVPPGGMRFDPGAGGVVCPRCGEGGNPVLAGTIEMMKFLQSADAARLRVIRPDRGMLREARAILSGYVGYHLGKTPRSTRVLETL